MPGKNVFFFEQADFSFSRMRRHLKKNLNIRGAEAETRGHSSSGNAVGQAIFAFHPLAPDDDFPDQRSPHKKVMPQYQYNTLKILIFFIKNFFEPHIFPKRNVWPSL